MKTRVDCTECGGTHDDCERAEVTQLGVALLQARGAIQIHSDREDAVAAVARGLVEALEWALSDDGGGYACPTATEERLHAALARAREVL